MKHKLLFYVLSSSALVLSLLSPSISYAEEALSANTALDASEASEATASNNSYTAPELSEAQAAIVVDAQGNIVFGYNIHAEFNMASITKIMTAVVALEHGLDLNGQITCRGSVLDENAQVAGYQAGDTVSARELFQAMLVYSANDAAYEIACSIAGSEDGFVSLMNAKAQELGMTHTVFKNSHGLDADGHHSSAYDLVQLARYALTTYSVISDTVKMESVTVTIAGQSITLDSTDEFVKNYAGALGIKTGMGNTTACFLGAARKNNLTLYSCVLGCSTSDGRFGDTYTLMNGAFDSYASTQLSDTNATITMPFAYHFGLSCEISADDSVWGLVSADTQCLQRTVSINQRSFAEPNTVCKVVQWYQDNRVVGTQSYSSSQTLVQSRSGFGLVGKLVNRGV